MITQTYFDPGMMSVMPYFIKIGIGIAGAMLIVRIGFASVRSLYSGKLEFTQVFTAGVVCLVIFNFNSIFPLVRDIGRSFNITFPVEGAISTEIELLRIKACPMPSIFDFSSIIMYICITFGQLASFIMEQFSYMCSVFLLLTCPISLGLSTIPGFDSLVKHWITSFLSVSCWMLSIHVINVMMHLYLSGVLSMYANIPVMEGVFNFKFAGGIFLLGLMYTIVPSLTAMYIGQSASHGVMSRMVGTATTVATVAVASSKLAGGKK